MAFDDEYPANLQGQAHANSTPEDDDLDDLAPDWRQFLKGSQSARKNVRKGDKDFESHGTKSQDNVLESSRSAMQEVLSFTRSHSKPKDYLRGYYFPDQWAGEPPEEDVGSGMWMRERVVVIHGAINAHARSMGRAYTGLSKENRVPGYNKDWLLPEEALYLVDRGDLDLWWPQQGIEEIFPLPREAGGTGKKQDNEFQEDDEPEELGVPLSVQAAYALFTGNEGERGKVTMEKYQVYSNLRRSGVFVQRVQPSRTNKEFGSSDRTQTVWQWLISLVLSSASEHQPPSTHPSLGPLVKPGLYRSYQPIYAQLHLLPRHKPHPQVKTTAPPKLPFKETYYIWRGRPEFSKTRPGEPDFRMAVVDARTTNVPSIEEIMPLLECSPWDPPEAKRGVNIGLMYKRLKNGWRNVLMAVVDGGFINYVRFSEMAFGEERLFENFDGITSGGSKKGRGQKGARGGRGGRGGGRGGVRGRGGRG